MKKFLKVLMVGLGFVILSGNPTTEVRPEENYVKIVSPKFLEEETTSGETTGEGTGETSGETSGDVTSGDVTSGDVTGGETSGETSGDVTGGETTGGGEVIDEEKPCKVVIEKSEHGSVEVDITEGKVGDIVTITAKHDMLYKIKGVYVNGTALIEDENTSGLFVFSLVEGENKITAEFVVDEELCGTLTDIISEATNKDWTNLFSMENVITLVKWLLDGGVLIAMVRYFVKDKRLADKLEEKVKETCEKIVPETTKNSVIENTKTIIEPMFNQVVQDGALARQLMGVMVKCMVLMQQNTPEAKIAILDEFEKLKGIADLDSIANIKKYIEEAVSQHSKAYEETLARIKNISEHHQENINESKESSEVKDNGTQI